MAAGCLQLFWSDCHDGCKLYQQSIVISGCTSFSGWRQCSTSALHACSALYFASVLGVGHWHVMVTTFEVI
jgi:hypothetical protein